MNEKINTIFFKKTTYLVIFGIFLFIILYLLSGCRTQSVIVDPNQSIVGGLDSLRQLREINERSRGILEESERFIDELVDSLGRGSIDFRTALQRYDQFVLYLIGRIEELERLSRGLDEEVLSGLDPAYYYVSIIYLKYYWENNLPQINEKRDKDS